jgi:hypothetical protein
MSYVLNKPMSPHMEKQSEIRTNEVLVLNPGKGLRADPHAPILDLLPIRV